MICILIYLCTIVIELFSEPILRICISCLFTAINRITLSTLPFAVLILLKKSFLNRLRKGLHFLNVDKFLNQSLNHSLVRLLGGSNSTAICKIVLRFRTHDKYWYFGWGINTNLTVIKICLWYENLWCFLKSLSTLINLFLIGSTVCACNQR